MMHTIIKPYLLILDPLLHCNSSTRAWKIPWMEEPGGLSRTQLSYFTFTFTFHFQALEKEMATHSSVLPWRIPGTRSLVGCRLWGRTESDKAEAT